MIYCIYLNNVFSLDSIKIYYLLKIIIHYIFTNFSNLIVYSLFKDFKILRMDDNQLLTKIQNVRFYLFFIGLCNYLPTSVYCLVMNLLCFFFIILLLDVY